MSDSCSSVGEAGGKMIPRTVLPSTRPGGRGALGRGRMATWILVAAASLAAAGCGPTYLQLRRNGQTAMIEQDFVVARTFLEMADEKNPQQADNLFDLGDCCVMLARNQFELGNRSAALRELDRAVGFYDRAITARPGHRAALRGKNIALELKGQFDAALGQAEWAAEYIGPSAEQQVWLAHELEERGDYDQALRRFRMAVAMEPKDAGAHVAFAEFLLRRNNEAAAVAHYQAAYRLDPKNRAAAEALIARGALPEVVPAAAGRP